MLGTRILNTRAALPTKSTIGDTKTRAKGRACGVRVKSACSHRDQNHHRCLLIDGDDLRENHTLLLCV